MKQILKTKEYVLKMDGLDLFVANKQKVYGCNITADISKARKYSVGFDNEKIKTGIWSAAIQKQCNNNDIKFDVVYL